MNDYLIKLLEYLKNSPSWVKVVFPLLSAALVAVYLLSSCGLTKATVRTNSDNSHGTITITTNNPTSVTVSPSLKVDSLSVNSKSK